MKEGETIYRLDSAKPWRALSSSDADRGLELVVDRPPLDLRTAQPTL
jgi:hypothetical protein